MTRQIWLLGAVALLAGCESLRPVRVEIPVAVPCVRERPQRPALATDQLPADATVHDKARALLAERHQLRGYVAELEAVIEACEVDR